AARRVRAASIRAGCRPSVGGRKGDSMPIRMMRRRVALLGGLGLVLAGVLSIAVLSGGAAGNFPADKVTATGQKPDIVGPGSSVTLLGPVKMRTSTPADLVLQVTAECSILTELTTQGN